MNRRSQVLFALIGLGLAGCSGSSDDSADLSAQALGATADQPAVRDALDDSTPATNADEAKHKKPILILCRPPVGTRHGDPRAETDVAEAPASAFARRGSEAPVPGAGEIPKGPPMGAIPCITPSKSKFVPQLVWLCSPALGRGHADLPGSGQKPGEAPVAFPAGEQGCGPNGGSEFGDRPQVDDVQGPPQPGGMPGGPEGARGKRMGPPPIICVATSHRKARIGAGPQGVEGGPETDPRDVVEGGAVPSGEAPAFPSFGDREIGANGGKPGFGDREIGADGIKPSFGDRELGKNGIKPLVVICMPRQGNPPHGATVSGPFQGLDGNADKAPANAEQEKAPFGMDGHAGARPPVLALSCLPLKALAGAPKGAPSSH